MGYIVRDDFPDVLMESSPDTLISNISKLPESPGKVENIEIPSYRETGLSIFDFKSQGYISVEPWNSTINLNARIVKIYSDRVTCECLVDKEKQIFEPRTFPKQLFDHLPNKKLKDPVIVSVKTKPGSTRIDIRDGKNIVDLSIFDLEDGWEELVDSRLDQPISFDNE